VAEGVETVAQRDYLASLDCAAYQGFLCSPGLPADAFEQLMATLPRN
jgi:EAL domain-containing protein (putative c-di-GMP-specific phosphodiesterase class I)